MQVQLRLTQWIINYFPKNVSAQQKLLKKRIVQREPRGKKIEQVLSTTQDLFLVFKKGLTQAIAQQCKELSNVIVTVYTFFSRQVVERLLSMPVDYWNQFINIEDENIRSPPYNPHHADGTPLTPECRPGK